MRGLYLFFLFVKKKNAGNISLVDYTYYYSPSMKQERLDRAQSISKKIISEYIITELQELSAEHGIITITEVKISNDLGYMDIFVSSLRSPETLTKALSEYAHPIHRSLGKKIEFVKVPKLRFRYDESGKDTSHIYAAIKDLHLK